MYMCRLHNKGNVYMHRVLNSGVGTRGAPGAGAPLCIRERITTSGHRDDI